MPSVEPPEVSPGSVEIRVSGAEVDKMGVVYYERCLRWFELGRAECLRARGTLQQELEAEGLQLPVVEVYARYREPARYDDLVQVRTALQQAGRERVTFSYQVLRQPDGALLVEGRTAHGCAGRDGRPRRLPSHLVARLSQGMGNMPSQ